MSISNSNVTTNNAQTRDVLQVKFLLTKFISDPFSYTKKKVEGLPLMQHFETNSCFDCYMSKGDKCGESSSGCIVKLTVEVI